MPVVPEDVVRASLRELIAQLTVDTDDPVAQVATARIVQEQIPAVLQEVVDTSRGRGASWKAIAEALNLKTASSAHWHYGKGRATDETTAKTKDDRLERLRRRAAETKSGVPSVELPGMSRQQAAVALGCDPKTVVRRAANQDGVRVEDVTSRRGKTVRRYFLL